MLTRKYDFITDDYGNFWHYCLEVDTNTCNRYSYWHREDGPSIIYTNGHVEWYINGSEVGPTEMPLSLFLAYCKHYLKME